MIEPTAILAIIIGYAVAKLVVSVAAAAAGGALLCWAQRRSSLQRRQ